MRDIAADSIVPPGERLCLEYGRSHDMPLLYSLQTLLLQFSIALVTRCQFHESTAKGRLYSAYKISGSTYELSCSVNSILPSS